MRNLSKRSKIGVGHFIFLQTLMLLSLFLILSHFVSFCGEFAKNEPPIADAGSDIQVLLGEEVVLDGSLSGDPEGCELFYYWNFDRVPPGSAITNESLSVNETQEAVNPSFIPDVEGYYALSLQTSDGVLMSDYDYVVVSVFRDNLPPVAILNTPPNAYIGEAVTLDGSKSYDPEGDFLSYTWSFITVPPDSHLTDSDIYNAATANAVIVPDVEGSYVVSLMVNDGFVDSDPAYGVVMAVSQDTPPIADAGQGQIITPCGGMEVNLDGSGSYDPDGDSLTYEWTFYMTPTGSSLTDADIYDSDTAYPYFTADITGLYVVQLVVNDGTSDSSPDAVGILVTEDEYNSAPVASAGSDQSFSETVSCYRSGYDCICPDCSSQTASIDGSASYDLNNDPLTYSWSITSGSATIADPTAVSTTVTIPSFSTSYHSTTTQTITISLTVSDCYESSSPDSLTITVSCYGGGSC